MAPGASEADGPEQALLRRDATPRHVPSQQPCSGPSASEAPEPCQSFAKASRTRLAAVAVGTRWLVSLKSQTDRAPAHLGDVAKGYREDILGHVLHLGCQGAEARHSHHHAHVPFIATVPAMQLDRQYDSGQKRVLY